MSGNGKTKANRKQPKRISKSLAKALSRRIMGQGGYGMYGGMPVGRSTLRGKGGFWGDLWDSTKKYIPRVGGAVAGYVANPTSPLLGAAGGWQHGADFSKSILGWGAYKRPRIRGKGASVLDDTMNNNGVTFASPVPAMHSEDESVRVHKVEYIGDLYTSSTIGAFSNRSIALNPGISFYWGSKLAGLFQQYKLNGAAFFFKSRASSYTSNTTLGTVMLCMDYNPHNEAFSNKQQMQETTGCVACSVDQNATCTVECDPKMTLAPIKYVRTGDVPSGEDKHLYDWGNMQIATSGSPVASANVGELYVSYDITYFKPKATAASTTELAMIYNTSSTAVTGFQPFGTRSAIPAAFAAAEIVADTFGLTVSTETISAHDMNRITIPAGHDGSYLVMAIYGMTGTVISAIIDTTTATFLTNCTVAAVYSGPYKYTTSCSATAGDTVTKFVHQMVIKITNPGAAASFCMPIARDAAGTNTLSSGQLVITPFNSKYD